MKRYWLFWLLIAAFLYYLISRWPEISALAGVLKQGQWEWIAVAGALQLLYYWTYAGLYKSAFHTVNIKSTIPHLFPIVLASLFVNVIVPTGGTAGPVLFVDDARRKGYSGAQASAGTLLFHVVYFGSFSIFLILGLASLFFYNQLAVYQLIGASIMFLLSGGLALVLLVGKNQPKVLTAIFKGFQVMMNGLAGLFRRPPFFANRWAHDITDDFSEAAVDIAEYPDRLQLTFANGILLHVVDILSLAAVFMAFHQSLAVGPLLAGYAMGILFWIVSPTPQGIGVVEGVMTLVFRTLGVATGPAAIIALAFRGLTFWIPLAIGFLLLRRVKTFHRHDEVDEQIDAATT